LKLLLRCPVNQQPFEFGYFIVAPAATAGAQRLIPVTFDASEKIPVSLHL